MKLAAAIHKVDIETNKKYVDPSRTLLKEALEMIESDKKKQSEEIGSLDFSDWE